MKIFSGTLNATKATLSDQSHVARKVGVTTKILRVAGVVVGAGTSALASVPSVLAHCPVCTAATGAAVVAARMYGIDDALVGVLVGGFAVSSAWWFGNWLKRKYGAFFAGQELALALASVLFTILGLKAGGLLTGALLMGFPRILTGTLLGSLAVVLAGYLHEVARLMNAGKNIIAYQGLSVTLAALLAVCAGLVLI